MEILRFSRRWNDGPLVVSFQTLRVYRSIVYVTFYAQNDDRTKSQNVLTKSDLVEIWNTPYKTKLN